MGFGEASPPQKTFFSAGTGGFAARTGEKAVLEGRCPSKPPKSESPNSMILLLFLDQTPTILSTCLLYSVYVFTREQSAGDFPNT